MPEDNNKNLEKQLIKCKICDQSVPEGEIRDHIKRCIYNVEYGDPPILHFIQEHLGDDELIAYLNNFGEPQFEVFFSPNEFKVIPIDYPIYSILGSVTRGSISDILND